MSVMTMLAPNVLGRIRLKPAITDNTRDRVHFSRMITMLRSIALRAVVTALLSAAFVAAPIKIGFATTPQEAQPKPDEKTYTAEQRFERRYPQAVKVGHLIGLPVLDDRDSTYGYIRAVIRGSDGNFHLIVTYRGWLGWAPPALGRKTVAVPVEAVAILARQVIALDFKRDLFVVAPEYSGTDAPLGADETIRMAGYRR